MYGLRQLSATPGSAPGQPPQVPTDAFRCPHRLERHKRPKGMSGTHSKNDSDQTGSQPRSSFIVHRSSFIVHRSSSVRPLLIRRTESSCFKLSIVYRLSGILRSLRSYAPYAPYSPGCLPTNRTPVCRWLLCNRLSTSTSTSVPAASPYQRSTGLS